MRPAPDMSIKVERQLHDMRILGDTDCGSAQRGTIRWYHKIPSQKVQTHMSLLIRAGYGLWECAARNNPLVSQNPLLKNRGYNMLKFILFLF